MKIDWTNPDWSYLLGVVHGDGTISARSVIVCVGYKDPDYANLIVELWHNLGFKPKIYRKRSAMSIEVHSRALRDQFALYKRPGLWTLPERFDAGQWVSGIFDTDGTVTSTPKCAIIISLRRSGNLNLVRDALEGFGIGPVRVIEGVSKFNGRPYEIETVRLSSFKNISRFSEATELRYPKKVERLRVMLDYIESKTPLWKKVAQFLSESPKTWKEVAGEFGLTKDQFDSVIQNVKKECEVETIPPPEPLHRFHVKGPLGRTRTK